MGKEEKAHEKSTAAAERHSDSLHGLGSAAKGAGKLIAGIGAAAAAGTLALGKMAVEGFGELEQNLGGSEAVFGAYAANIQKISEDAYKAMGTSQSDYLATANKMGALFQGSGVEQERSMELSAQAMQRAADMASVMGIETSAALEAVTGAAKGNYTMMDNLGVAMNVTTLAAYAAKNGFGEMTADLEKAEKAQQKLANTELKQESAQLKYNEIVKKYDKNSYEAKQAAISLEQAINNTAAAQSDYESALSGGETSAGSLWNSLDNAQRAEVAMVYFFEQTEQYAGNFEREATETVSGSIGLLSASVESWVAGLGNSEADIEKLTGNVTDAFGAVVKNTVPVVQNAVRALPMAISSVTAVLPSILPDLLDTVSGLFQSVLSMLITLLPELSPIVVEALFMVIDTITENLPLLPDVGFDVLMALTDGLISAVPRLLDAAVDLIPMITSKLTEDGVISDMFDAGAELIKELARGFPEAAEAIRESLPVVVQIIKDELDKTDWLAVSVEVFDGLGEGFLSIFNGALAAVDAALGTSFEKWAVKAQDFFRETGSKLYELIHAGEINIDELHEKYSGTLQAIRYDAIENMRNGMSPEEALKAAEDKNLTTSEALYYYQTVLPQEIEEANSYKDWTTADTIQVVTQFGTVPGLLKLNELREHLFTAPPTKISHPSEMIYEWQENLIESKAYEEDYAAHPDKYINNSADYYEWVEGDGVDITPQNSPIAFDGTVSSDTAAPLTEEGIYEAVYAATVAGRQDSQEERTPVSVTVEIDGEAVGKASAAYNDEQSDSSNGVY